MSDESKSESLTSTLKRLGDSALSMAQTRLELAADEFRDERARWMRVLVLAAALVGFGALTILVFTVTVIVVFWDKGRVWALGGLTVVYGGLTAWAFFQARRVVREARPFQDSLDELRKDRECLREKSRE